MPRKIFYLALFVPFLLFASGHKNLKLSHALKLAKESNLELSLASLEEQIKKIEVKIVQGQYYGKLDLVQNMAYSDDAGNVFGFKLSNRKASFKDFGFSEFDLQRNVLHVKPKDLNYPKPRSYFQTKFQYSLPIYTGGKLSSYKKIKKSFVTLASLDKQTKEKRVLLDVKKTYGDILLVDTFVKNLILIRQNIEKLERMSQSMVKEGYAKKVDVLEVASKKANIIRMINQSLANKELALQYLSFLLNQKIISIDTNSYTPPEEFFISKKALDESMHIKKAKEGHEMSKTQVKLAKSSFLPTAGLMAEYSSSDEKFLGNFAKHDAYTIGVQIEWNLFSGGSDKQAYEKAKIEQLKAKKQLNLAKSGMWLKANRLKTQIKKINFDIQSLDSELELAKVIYENYLGRYQEKLVSINDVIIKQSHEIELVLKLQELKNKKYAKIYELEELF